MSIADQLGVIVIDEHGAIVHADEAAGRLCGWAPELLCERSIDRILRAVESEEPGAPTSCYLTSSARRVTVQRRPLGPGRAETILLLVPASCGVECDPIDELRERLDEIAQLSHKINNPLASVLGRVQLLRMTGDDPKVDRAATIIEDSAHRIAGYVRELAVAARRHAGTPLHEGLARPTRKSKD